MAKNLEQQISNLTDLRVRELLDDEEFEEKRIGLRMKLAEAKENQQNVQNNQISFEPIKSLAMFCNRAKFWFQRADRSQQQRLLQIVCSNPQLINKTALLEPTKPFQELHQMYQFLLQRGEVALQASGCDQVSVLHKPRLLSDNGSSYVSGELAEWLSDKGMDHVRGAPYHPQTQGKIERWHQTLKNRILLENYFYPADLRNQIEAFVEHYNHQRYHESLQNLTPADVYFGRGQAILNQRERIKQKTMQTRRLQHRKAAA